MAAVCRGLTKAGVAPSPKHFPGHGDTHVDSHLSLPVILKDATSLAQTDLVPFRAARNAGAATIMVGHMALPVITGDTSPASLSRVVINNILRESLEYDGVVVTDCLEMEAVAAREGGVPAAAVDALQAGADIVMICHRIDRQRGALEAVYGAIRGGILDREQIRASERRIAALKDAFAGSWVQVLGTTFDEARWGRLKAENALLSRQAYASTIALVRNPHDIIPLPKAEETRGRGRIVVVLTPRMESLNRAIDDAGSGSESDADAGESDAVPSGRRGDDDHRKLLRNAAGPSYLSFAAGVRRRVHGASLTVLHDVYSSPEEEPILGAEVADAIDRGAASSVLFVTRNADRSTWQLDRLREVLRRVGKKEGPPQPPRCRVVVLASCGPYDLLLGGAAPGFGEEEGLGLDEVGYVASFEFTPDALDAAAAVIFGEEEARGRAPVCGGHIFP